jgi:hypothetical protein
VVNPDPVCVGTSVAQRVRTLLAACEIVGFEIARGTP